MYFISTILSRNWRYWSKHSDMPSRLTVPEILPEAESCGNGSPRDWQQQHAVHGKQLLHKSERSTECQLQESARLNESEASWRRGCKESGWSSDFTLGFNGFTRRCSAHFFTIGLLFHGEAWLLFLRIVRIQSPGAKILKVKAHQVENLNWYVELYRTI